MTRPRERANCVAIATASGPAMMRGGGGGGLDAAHAEPRIATQTNAFSVLWFKVAFRSARAGRPPGTMLPLPFQRIPQPGVKVSYAPQERRPVRQHGRARR